MNWVITVLVGLINTGQMVTAASTTTSAESPASSSDSSTSSLSSNILSVQNITVPALNVQSLGRMGLVGQFDGISQYEYLGQQKLTAPLTSNDNIIGYNAATNQYIDLGSLNGKVSDACILDNNYVYFAGNFSEYNGKATSAGMAYLETSSGNVTIVSSGPKGTISSLYCDNDNKAVYVGGDISFNNSYGIALWQHDDNSWQSPVFGGFKGNSSAVYAIQPYGDNLVFGGRFKGLTANVTGDNDGSDNGNLTSSLSSLEQQVSFDLATLQAEGTAPGYDPASIYCPQNNGASWLMTDNRAGTWQLAVPFTFVPTRIRLWNLDDDQNGTKTWRFLGFPLNGIMNLTYVDPDSNERQHCDAWCPLPQAKQQEYLDFEFVNPVEMDSFQLYITDFYGQAAGLRGVQVYQQEMFTYANNTLNQPFKCATDITMQGGSSVKGSNWQSQKQPGNTLYMSSTLTDASQLGDYGVTFKPNVTGRGNYSLLLYTPGCTGDGTCSQRGGVKVSVYPEQGQDPVEKVLYQTNQFEKYDQIYNGTLKPSKNFQPYVEMVPLAGQTSFPLVFVAERVKFLVQSIDKGNQTEPVVLNGLFEYSPKNFTEWSKNSSFTPVGSTFINGAGTNLSDDTEIRGLFAGDKSLVIGGSFDYNNQKNFAVLTDGSSSPSAASSPSVDPVTKFLVASNNSLAVQFNSSAVSLYDADSNKWTTILNAAQGVSNMAVFNGSYLALSDSELQSSSSSSLQLWDIGSNKWYNSSSLISGHVSSSAESGLTVYFGSLRMFDRAASGLIFLDQSFDIDSVPDLGLSLSASSSNSSLSPVSRGLNKKVGLSTGTEESPIINVGLFVNNSLTILGGKFSGSSDNGSSFENVVLVSNKSMSGLPYNLDGQVYSLLANDDTLFIGGQISATVEGNNIGGLAFYYINNNTFAETQPAGLSGGDSIVTSLSVLPNTNQLVVTGSFTQAGSLGCNAFCIYDLEASRWNSPAPGFGGFVNQAEFIGSDTIFFAGQLTMNNTNAYFAEYNFDTSSFSSDNQMSSGLPGPVNTFVLNGDGVSSMFAAGVSNSSSSSFLGHWNGSGWTFIDSPFEAGTYISQLSLVGLAQNHEKNDVLPQEELLMATGNIILKQFGNVSCVLFDGQNWQPLFLTADGQSSSGSMTMFYSQSTQRFGALLGKNYMARGFVVLVSLAIAVGLVMLMILFGLIVSYLRKRHQGYRPANNRLSEADMTQTVPPANLLHELNTFKT